jgi:hypothetical protein
VQALTGFFILRNYRAKAQRRKEEKNIFSFKTLRLCVLAREEVFKWRLLPGQL